MFGITVLYGSTRKVYLTKKYAIKVPVCDTWENFLYGLLGNMQELYYSKVCEGFVAPILWHIPGGFLSIMPRCEVQSIDESNTNRFKDIDEWMIRLSREASPKVKKILENIVEFKIDSVGVYKGKAVAIDYGSKGDTFGYEV